MNNEQIILRRRLLSAVGFPSPVRVDIELGLDVAQLPPRRPVATVSCCLALIATRNFLPFAKLAARSFLTHHPEFRAFLLLVDGDPSDAPEFSEGHVVLLSDLGLSDVGWYAAKFTASELANALKPSFLRYLSGIAERAIYLDCDIAVFSRLSEMIDLMGTSDLVLVPHMLAPPPRPEQFWTHPTRADIFNSGLVNAGSFGINLARCGDIPDVLGGGEFRSWRVL